MTRFARCVLLLAVGTIVVRITLDGHFNSFVQQRMRWPLLLAGIIVVGLAVVDLVIASRDDDETNQRPISPGVGWLLIAPVAVIISVAPDALGASAADRIDAYDPPAPIDPLAPILPETDPFPIKMLDFVNLAMWDETRALEGRQVDVEGIVVNDPEVADGFLLIRFVVSCCAADGIPIKVAVTGTPSAFEDDTWVRATIEWIPPDVPYQDENGPKFVEARLVDITEIDEPPGSPYESPF